LRGGGEELADEVGGVDLHLLGEFAAQERDEEEVELFGFGEVLDAGVAEANAFALGVGDDGDVGLGVEADAEAGAVEGFAEPGVGFDVDDDAVGGEADLGVFGVDEAGGVGVAADVVAVVGAGEELFQEGALKGFGGDFDLEGVGGQRREGEQGGETDGGGGGTHVGRISDGAVWAFGLASAVCCIQGRFAVRAGDMMERFGWWARWAVCGLVVVVFSGVAVAAVKPVVTVAADGTGKFKTVQEAVDSAGADGLVVKLAPGTYREKLHVAGNGIELRGMGAGPKDVVLSWDDSAGTAGGTGKSGSVTVTGDDFTAVNLTMENSWERTHQAGAERPHEGAQAVALLVSGDREVFRNVRLLGFQDTLYAGSKTCHDKDAPGKGFCQAGRMYFKDCYIEGHVDFIFGDAKAVFDHCELHAMAHPTVMLTAQSKLYPDEDSGYLFLDCTVTADKGAEKIIMGRPWRAYATVIFVNTKLDGAKIAPVGWSDWDGKLATATYAEYNTGPGDDTSQRIAGTHVLTAEQAKKLTVDAWLGGKDGWKAESSD
jgi:pectinesterase